MPRLDFGAAPSLSEKDRASFTDNFLVAFARSCADGLLRDGPLVDQRARVKDTIAVLDAPEANITSIYFAPPAMLLESPFGDPPQIPSVEDIHEAIYCLKKGATPEEEEASGRCLAD